MDLDESIENGHVANAEAQPVKSPMVSTPSSLFCDEFVFVFCALEVMFTKLN